MANVPVFVGVDYHQDQLQVCAIDQAANVRVNRGCANDAAAVAGLLRGLGGDVRAVAVEACCGAADLSQRLVDQFGWKVSLGHPAYIAKLKGSPDKCDFSDGRLVADLTRVYTGNDDTNAPMLAINRRLGYEPCSTMSTWTKRYVTSEP